MLAAPAPRPTARTLARVAAAIVTALWTTTAYAEGPEVSTDYCQKVTAHAEADAALLYAPTVRGQLIRFPPGSPADTTGVQIGNGIQPRASMTVGVIDIYRGLGVMEVAKADCRRQQSAAALEDVLAQEGVIGRVPALQKKIAFLRSRESAVEAIVRSAEARFAAHTSTLGELQDVRLHALSFSRGLAEAERDLAILDTRGAASPGGSLLEAVALHEQRAAQLESRLAHVRNLRPWSLNVTGGVAATPSAEVFGVAELSYNLGGLFHVNAENRAVEARASELKKARYEFRARIEAVSRELRVNAEQSIKQARAIEAELARLARDRASLDGADAPQMPAALAMMNLKMIDLEAEHTFLVALADAQSKFGRGN